MPNALRPRLKPETLRYLLETLDAAEQELERAHAVFRAAEIEYEAVTGVAEILRDGRAALAALETGRLAARRAISAEPDDASYPSPRAG